MKTFSIEITTTLGEKYIIPRDDNYIYSDGMCRIKLQNGYCVYSGTYASIKDARPVENK